MDKKFFFESQSINYSPKSKMENCLIFYDVEFYFYVLGLILEGISETLGEVNELLFSTSRSDFLNQPSFIGENGWR